MRRSPIPHRIALLAALTALAGLAAPAAAHLATSTRSRVIVVPGDPGGEVQYTLTVPLADLPEVLDLGGHREPTVRDVRAGGDRLLRYFMDRVRLEAGGAACPTEPRGVDIREDTALYAEIRFTARCPRPIRALAIDYQIFFDLDPQHVGFLEVSCAGRIIRGELTYNARRKELRCDPPAAPGMNGSAGLVSGERVGYGVAAFLVMVAAIVAARRRGVRRGTGGRGRRARRGRA